INLLKATGAYIVPTAACRRSRESQFLQTTRLRAPRKMRTVWHPPGCHLLLRRRQRCAAALCAALGRSDAINCATARIAAGPILHASCRRPTARPDGLAALIATPILERQTL